MTRMTNDFSLEDLEAALVLDSHASLAASGVEAVSVVVVAEDASAVVDVDAVADAADADAAVVKENIGFKRIPASVQGSLFYT